MLKYSIAVRSTKPGTKKANITETKAYGAAQVHESVSFDDFCDHISDHNSPFSSGTIKGILTDAVRCLREELLKGNSVEFGDLGRFRIELSTTGAVTTDDFTVQNIKAVNPRWTPGRRFRSLRQDATFQLVPSRKAKADAIEVVKNSETIHGLE